MPVFERALPTQGIVPQGGLVNEMEGRRWDVGLYRPFIDDKYNRPYVIVNTNEWTVEKGERRPLRRAKRVVDVLNDGIINPVLLMANANALRKEQWIELDRVLVEVSRPRLRFWGDLMSAVPYGGFDAMSKMTLEYEAMTDSGVAMQDMDALSEGRADQPQFLLRSLPLPLTHSDFHFSQRMLNVSGNSGPSLDFQQGKNAARRVSEVVEDVSIGLKTGIQFGDVTTGPTAHDTTTLGAISGGTLASKVYGALTFPHRIISVQMTKPTSTGWHPQLAYHEILAARELLYTANHFGPFVIYNSTDWDQYLDDVFFYKQAGAAATNLTPTASLRNAIRAIDGISDVRRLDRMTATATPFRMIFVEMMSDNVEAVNGMGLTTMQWPTMGGLRVNFKVMCCWVSRFRSDAKGQCGLLDLRATL